MNRSDEPDRLRLVPNWHSGVWVGAVCRAFGPISELVDGQGDTFEHRPVQWLVALWKPATLREPFLRRWPEMVQLTEAEGDAAVRELLAHVPEGERLWLNGSEIDWALMAEIVLLTEEDLQPWQHRELARFIVEQRKATAAAISVHYVGQDDDGFSPTVPVLDRW